jgi:hypothetical protein
MSLAGVVNVPRVDELASFLGWPGKVVPGLSWKDVEESLGIKFPKAYKELLDVFPSGEMADGIRLVSPVEDAETLELFRARIEISYEYFTSAREMLPDRFPHKFHPELDGLIAWAIDDDHTYFWDPSRGPDPDGWPVVFLENTGPGWGSYEGSVVDFLFEVVSGTLLDEALYSDWADAEKTFHPIRFR